MMNQIFKKKDYIIEHIERHYFGRQIERYNFWTSFVN